MSRITERVDGWLGAPMTATRLASLRILVGTFAVLYLVVRFPALDALGRASPVEFEPVGVLWFLGAPLPAAAVTTVLLAAIVTGAAFTAGVLFRVTGPLFAVLFLAVATYHSSWGQLLWYENLPALHLLVVGLAPSADALTVVRRSGAGAGASARYGWPVRLAAITTVVTYLIAGIAKLRIGGTGWLDGDTLRNHVAYSATRLDVLGGSPSPLAGIVEGWMMTPVAWGTIGLELLAPVALAGGRARTVWVISAWAMHAGIAALMFVVFPYPLSGVAYAPLFAIERPWPGWLTSRRRSASPPSPAPEGHPGDRSTPTRWPGS